MARAYYQRHGAGYRNPHEAIVRKIPAAAVAEWPMDLSRVPDLACGSGEATVTLRGFEAAIKVRPDMRNNLQPRIDHGRKRQVHNLKVF